MVEQGVHIFPYDKITDRWGDKKKPIHKKGVLLK